jgi:hypothetical protein
VILAEVGEEPVCNIAEGCTFDGGGAPEERMGVVQYDTAA